MIAKAINIRHAFIILMALFVFYGNGSAFPSELNSGNLLGFTRSQNTNISGLRSVAESQNIDDIIDSFGVFSLENSLQSGKNFNSNNFVPNLAAPPANDPFSGAFIISGSNGESFGTTLEATRETGEPTVTGNRTVWYRWTAPSSGSVRFRVTRVGSVCPATGAGQRITVYTGSSITGLSIIAQDNDICGSGNLASVSEVVFTVTQNIQYRIVVDGFFSGFVTTGVDFSLSWVLTPTVSVSGQLRNVNGSAITNPNNCDGPCTVNLNVVCSGGFTSNFFVTQNFTVQVPQNAGTCTFTPSTQNGFGITSWNPSSIARTVGTQSVTGVNFAAAGPSFTVIGLISPDVNGVTVTSALLNTATVQNCDINSSTRVYTCGVVIYGDYRIMPVHATNTYTPAPQEYLAIRGNITNQNYTALPGISGRVTRNGVGLSGVTITLSGTGTGTRTTDSNGNYSFTGLTSGGNYTVTPSLSGHTFSAPSQTFNNLSTNQTANFTALQNVTISGRLKNVGNFTLPGSAQVAINVSCSNGFSANPTVSGSYSIQVPQNAGNCTLTPSTSNGSNAGVSLWDPSSRAVTVGTTNITGIDFTARFPTYNVTGTLNNLGNTVGVSVGLSLGGVGTVANACTFNTSTRVYTCSGLSIYGDYTISPFQQNTVFDPASRLHPSITANASNQNFTAVENRMLSISNATVTEGNSGTSALNFTVSLSAASSQNVTVNYSTANGTASAGADYQTVTNGTVTIAAGQTSANATVQVIGDTLDEQNETLSVTLSNAQGATISQATATGTIVDDDTAGTVQFSASNYTVNEADGTATITATRSGGAASGVSVNYATSNGTASSGQDYTASSGTITFAANETSKTFTIPVINDTTDEADETVNIALSNAAGGATIGTPSTAVLTIIDNDGAPTLSINDVSQSEGNSASVPFVFVVRLSAASSQTITVNYATANGSATSPSDYQGVSGALTFAPGETSRSVIVSVIGDTLFEPDETFTVNLSGASGGITISDTQGIGTIRNDDASSPTAAKTRFDFDGDRRADISVFRPSEGIWYLLGSQSGFSSVGFGLANDKLVPADYDGDEKTDIAVWRENPADAQRAEFFILQSSDNTMRRIQFGSTGDRPVSGDFNGDGRDDLAVYREGTTAGAQSHFYYRSLNQTGSDFVSVQWGSNLDKPVPADYDGDGRADIAVYRPSNGVWYVLQSSTGQLNATQFGISEDKPVVGDYDGDGRADQAVYRPSVGVWFLLQSTRGFGAAQFGIAEDKPVAADYDGDGRADIAVYRPSLGVWYVLRSQDGSFYGVGFGTGNDRPVPNSFVP